MLPATNTRVAAYCRVSTNLEIQQSSLELQMQSFENYINAKPNWTLAKIYADKGLSGTTVKQREAFNQMIQDAENGNIDYILAKSISRFARNTVDALNYCRKLKAKGVGIYFEEQNLDTMSASSEIILTIQAAFAQEESHSFSENMKKGIRQRFAMGIPKWSETYGYRQIDDRLWEVHQEEAKVVKCIYELYLKGMGLTQIKKYLEKKEIPPPQTKRTHEKNWWSHTLSTILHNEKYVGDVEMQKTYVSDFLTGTRVNNRNQKIEKYYVKNHHEAIIDREMFRIVQHITMLKHTNRGVMQYPYYGFLTCPCCGEKMLRCILPMVKRENAWFCPKRCHHVAVKDKNIGKAILTAFHEGNLTDLHHEKIKTVEHYDLCRHVESITFAKENYTKLQITLKDGTTKQYALPPSAVYKKANFIQNLQVVEDVVPKVKKDNQLKESP